MTRRIVALTIVLAVLISFLPSTFLAELASANPYNFPVPSMKIISPPDPPNRYENRTVSLEIQVYLLNDSPKLQSIYYSLDGGPSVYLDFTTLRNSSWGIDRNGYSVGAKVDLENLSEGSHKVNAYSADINGNVIAASTRTFTVDSHYQVTLVEILSPENITYSTKEIPLIFTLNGEFKNASCHFLPPSPIVSNITGNEIAGNTTLTGLPDGFYRILLWVFADGKGGSRAYFEFTINSSPTSSDTPTDPEPFPTGQAIAATASIAVAAVGLFVFFKKSKH